MTNTELILSMLAEDSTKDISQAVNPKDFDQSKKMPNKVVVLPDMHAKNWNQQQEKKVVIELNVKTFIENNKKKLK